MAKYDYHCRGCNSYEEVERSIHAEEEIINCPKCGTAMRKVYGPINVSLKGSGFYRNDSNRQAENFYPESGNSI
jgi:putative FmdB family regulatory protein